MRTAPFSFRALPHRVIAALLSGAGACHAVAQPTFTLIRVVTEGDMVAGVGAVTTALNVAVNNGGTWLVEVDTNNSDTNADSAILKSGTLLLQENQDLIGLEVGGFSSMDGFTINSDGNVGSNFFLRNTTNGGNNDSGLFYNTTLIFQEGTISNSPAFSANTPYIGFFDAAMNDSNRLFVIATVDDAAIPTTADRALVMVDYSPGTGAYSEAVVYKEGDVPSGQTQAVADFGTGPHTYAISNTGHFIYSVDLAGDTAVDGAIYLGASTVVAQEGLASPESGRTYATLIGRNVHVNDAGDVVLRAALSGDAASNEVIIRKLSGESATIFAQEGQVIPSLAPHSLTAFGTGPVYISDGGHVVWVADTNNPDTTADISIMYDGAIVLQEGQSIDGMTVTTIRSIEAGYAISPGGSHVIIRCLLDDAGNSLEAAILATIDCAADFDDDGFVTGIDFDLYVLAFEAGEASADFDGDGFITGIDFDLYVEAYEKGC